MIDPNVGLNSTGTFATDFEVLNSNNEAGRSDNLVVMPHIALVSFLEYLFISAEWIGPRTVLSIPSYAFFDGLQVTPS